MFRRCGERILGRSALRCYLSLTFGANIFVLVLSFGSVTLSGVVIRFTGIVMHGTNDNWEIVLSIAFITGTSLLILGWGL